MYCSLDGLQLHALHFSCPGKTASASAWFTVRRVCAMHALSPGSDSAIQASSTAVVYSYQFKNERHAGSEAQVCFRPGESLASTAESLASTTASCKKKPLGDRVEDQVFSRKLQSLQHHRIRLPVKKLPAFGSALRVCSALNERGEAPQPQTPTLRLRRTHDKDCSTRYPAKNSRPDCLDLSNIVARPKQLLRAIDITVRFTASLYVLLC